MDMSAVMKESGPRGNNSTALLWPGEQHVDQSELVVFDVATKAATVVATAPAGKAAWADQGLSVNTDKQFHYADDPAPSRSLWLGDDSAELFFTRTSRDRHRVDTMVRQPCASSGFEPTISHRHVSKMCVQGAF